MAIIGNGDIAKALKEVDRDDLLFFASGVSNSLETDNKQYAREYDLLWKQDKNMHVVYFSSLCIYYSNSRYAQHKIQMEDNVKFWFNHFTIVRLGNIAWGDNPHTLINYFRNAIKNKLPYGIKDEYRYIIEKEEFLHWMKMIPKRSCEMNLSGRMLKVEEIVKQYGYT